MSDVANLSRGYLIKVVTDSHWGHYVGGINGSIGAICPNCDKPLIRHLTLSTLDPRLGLERLAVRELPLFYCGRCALSWEPFVYTIASDLSVELVLVSTGERAWDEWYDAVGTDEFPKRVIDLQGIPLRITELYTRLFHGEALSRDEESEIAAFTGQYAESGVGGYPIVDAVNQVGGQPYMIQGQRAPLCTKCARLGHTVTMCFLASLTNDHRQGLIFSFDGVQIVYYVCLECLSLHVTHAC